jgi:CHAT domain-containing protein
LAELAASGPLSVRYLQDFDGGLPITPILLENEDLANAVAEGVCEIRTVPALVFSQEEFSFTPQTIVAINESSEDLLLPAYEGEAIAAAAGMRLEHVASAKNERSLGEVIGEAEALIVSTHGLPLGIFTDAIFAGMNEKHVISVAALQDEAAKYKLKLVILNACNSGTSAGRNFQKRFRTSDSVTFPSLFLLNRQAVVSASLWKVSDTVSYVYACLVGDALARGLRPALALASSAALIKRVTKTQAIALLQRISDPMARESAINRLTSAPEAGLFSNPYLYGALALFGLL